MASLHLLAQSLHRPGHDIAIGAIAATLGAFGRYIAAKRTGDVLGLGAASLDLLDGFHSIPRGLQRTMRRQLSQIRKEGLPMRN